MNLLRHKHRSFLYSLCIHLLLGAVVFGAYYANHSKAHEEYSKVDLKSLQICTPVLQQSPPEEPLAAACPCADEPQILKQPAKEPKKIAKSKPLPKISKAETLLAAGEAHIEENLPQDLQEVAQDKTDEAAMQHSAAVTKLQTTDVPAASALASEPALTYEARYMQDNIALINALIKQNLNYPHLAKKRGLQGRAIVSFTINTQGEVTDIEASGEAAAILKKSALLTIKKASVDFPCPEMTLALQIPIVYKLN